MDALNLITIAKILVTLIACISAALIVFTLIGKTDTFVALSKEAIKSKMDSVEGKKSYFNKSSLEAFLSQTGIMYRRNDYELDPVTFIFEKIIYGALTSIATLIVAPTFTIKILGAILMFFVGFMLPDVNAKSKNRKDNLEMEDDIVTIYSTLKTEARAGLFIGDSLIDCQRSVTNKRLKKALTELNNNILSRKMTMEEAISVFKMRFDNPQIDDLADIIKQSFRTGRIIEMTKDISGQIEDNNKIRFENEKIKAKKSATMLSIAFFSGIIVLALYTVGLQLGEGLMSLW